MTMKQLAARLLENGQLTLADLALDLDKAGVKYNELFGFKPEVDVLKQIEKEMV